MNDLTMSDSDTKIIYTLTDESPLLATYSLYPVLSAFFKAAGITIETRDISLSARILSELSDYLPAGDRSSDALAELSQLTRDPHSILIKLPNISASIPQLRAAIKELQEQGYAIPDYPESAETEEEEKVRSHYSKVLGSAVNPVLRQGNSDRRVPLAVKKSAQKNPHSMKRWSPASRTHVAHMHHGDFYSSEKSMTVEEACDVRMELVSKGGEVELLKEKVSLIDGEIIDSMFMSKKALIKFLNYELKDAKRTGVLFSFHVKATMMKISHPIVFGHAVRIFYKSLFKRHGKLFDELGVNANNGISSVYEKIKSLPRSRRKEIEFDIHTCYAKRAEMAMVDPTEGITNLHSPNDVIVDASVPAMIRNGGKMRSPHGKLKDTKAVMPESTFARIYQEMISFCKTHGRFDPTTMGTVPNVGLMAQKAEEYGSHDKTFEIPFDGIARVVKHDGTVLLEQDVEEGDIWRMCQTKDEAIRDWVKLAVRRARETASPTIFWLDRYRPHDAEIIKKVETYLAEYDLSGTRIEIMSPLRAMRFTLERIIRGKDTVSVTGNILRDYLTDLFPIMEVGTSSKMLSIVPMMNGGFMFETGAGGTAPVLVKQLLEENHFCWDSLGELLAIASSLEEYSSKTGDRRAKILADTLSVATSRLLDENKSPSPRTGEMDTRGSHFYLAMYWAQALAEQHDDEEVAERYSVVAQQLADNESKINAELDESYRLPVDIKGYYAADKASMTTLMRPSNAFNETLQILAG